MGKFDQKTPKSPAIGELIMMHRVWHSIKFRQVLIPDCCYSEQADTILNQGKERVRRDALRIRMHRVTMSRFEVLLDVVQSEVG